MSETEKGLNIMGVKEKWGFSIALVTTVVAAIVLTIMLEDKLALGTLTHDRVKDLVVIGAVAFVVVMAIGDWAESYAAGGMKHAALGWKLGSKSIAPAM